MRLVTAIALSWSIQAAGVLGGLVLAYDLHMITLALFVTACGVKIGDEVRHQAASAQK